MRLLAFLAALLISGAAQAQCVGGLQAANNLSDVCSTSTARTNLGVSTSTVSAASGISIPVCPAGVGCPTTATPDIYPLPIAVAIPNSTTPSVICRVSPAATVTVIVKKWTAGNPASATTIGTFSVSTACAISGTAISVTSFSAGDGISAEATEASADAAAVVSVAIPFNKQ